MAFDTKYTNVHQYRYAITLNLLAKYVNKEEEQILDLGEENPFSEAMKKNEYRVENTPKGLDLDIDADWIGNKNVDVVTAFEIFEHLTNPFQVLKEIKAKKLIATVPLNL